MYKLEKIILCYLIFAALMSSHVSYADTKQKVAIETSLKMHRDSAINHSPAYESQMAIEDYVGTWTGEVAGEHAEIAIWLVQKGLKPYLGGYMIFHGFECIQKVDGGTLSMMHYDEISKSILNPLSKDVYKNAYSLDSRFPIRELRNNGCSRLKATSKLSNGTFSSYLTGGIPGETIKLSYSVIEKHDNLPYDLVATTMSRGKASPLMQEMLRKGYGFIMYETAAPSHAELKILNSLHD